MSNAQSEPNSLTSNGSAVNESSNYKRLRIWPPVLFIAIAVVLRLIPRVIADVPVLLEMISVISPGVCGILVMLWWLFFSRATAWERVIGFIGVSLSFIITLLLLHQSMLMPGTLIITVPMGMAAFALGAILLSKTLLFKRTLLAVLCAVLGFGFSTLLRSDGMWGEFADLELYWRWQQSHEERMMARQEQQPGSEQIQLANDQADLWLAKPEWSEFRGSDRTSRSYGPPISSDWSTSPPELLWKIEVGPGWSSFAVAGNLLFTQEQRGPQEMVICYAAETGQEIWTQAVETRFFESMGGVGPRATPTLKNGKLFVMGANGHLMSLDPKTGNINWQVDLQKVAGRTPPEWGFSSSPLVTETNVIVHAGGEIDKGTLAFDAETGKLNWSVPAGDHSYSSPQLSKIAGEEMVLMLTNTGLDFLDPQTGAQRLFYPWEHSGYRVLQPQLVESDSILIPTGMTDGTRRIRVTSNEGKLSTEEIWTSRHLKPDFNDFVVHQGHCYGFDGAIFTCVELTSGKRTWKGGRYGKGQVLLLVESGLLLIASETGDIVLLKTDPTQRQELAKFKALEGKTWNHPVVTGDRLYHRNAQEAACYQLPLIAEESSLVLDRSRLQP